MNALHMSNEERLFLVNYFIFKKAREVDTKDGDDRRYTRKYKRSRNRRAI